MTKRFLLFVTLTMLFIAKTFSQNIVKQCDATNLYYSCGAMNPAQLNSGPWMQIVVNNNWNSGFESYSVDYGTWTEYDNGTAKLTGRISQVIDPTVKWDMDFTFTGKNTVGPPHFSNDNWHCNSTQLNTSNWYYYSGGTNCFFIGVTGSKVQGAKLSCSITMGVQVGTGAAANSPTSFSMNTWMNMQVASQPNTGSWIDANYLSTGGGDIYIDLKNCSVPNTCNNLTSGGTIGSDQTGCSPYTASLINSLTLPSGGDATKAIEYVWLKTTDPTGISNLPTCDANGVVNLKSWVEIANSNTATLNPGTVSQTTWYLRCARRAGCVCYYGESNIVKITITGACTTCNNLTSGGTIGSDQTGCSPYTASLINSLTLPSGGDATKAIEYVWLKTTDPTGISNLPTCDANGVVNLKSWVQIANSNSTTLNPGTVSQTTWYLRCARRAGCVCYYGESNIVKITITGNCGGTCPNLVTNGSFGAGFTGFQTDIVHKSGPDCGNGGAIAVRSNPNQWGFSANCSDQDGNGAQLLVDFPSGDVWQKIWAQTVAVEQNKTYTFTFWAQNIYPQNPAQLYAVINSQTFPVKILPTTTCEWVKYEVQWNSGSSNSANLMIKNNSAECVGNDFGIDNISFSCSIPTCNNLTSGGTIGSDQSGCSPYTASIINNLTLPSGGDVTKAIEYVWLKTTDPTGISNLPTCDVNGVVNLKSWVEIANSNSTTLNPGSVSQTTWYLRCARRAGCVCYYGESNIVKITITGTCTSIPTTCTTYTISNANGCSNGAYAFYLNGVSYTVQSGTFTDNANGTATLVATYTQVGNSANIVKANVTFTGRTTVAGTDSPKYGLCINSGGSSWYYFTAFSGTIVQNGVTTNISQYGPAFQVGNGANLNNTAFGAAAWFKNTNTGANIGDFNFSLINPTACLTCNNLTSGGTIGSDQTGCSPYTASLINSLTLPSGGDATKAIEYVWLKTTDPTGISNLPTCDANGVVNLKSWVEIANSNSTTLNPGSISQTTWYLRCARRAGCVCYYGESNIVKITITGTCTSPCESFGTSTTLLHYTMNSCSAGSSFTEFTPTVNKGCLSSVSGTVFSSLTGSHSCNPGQSSLAICAQASSSSLYSTTVYTKAFTFNATVTPNSGSKGKLTSLTFYQRSTNPAYFSNGTTQANNRLTKLAVRIKDGTTVVFEQKDVAVSSSAWGLITINLSGTTNLEFSASKTYTIEIAAYAPVISSFYTTNYIFDIDEVKLNAACSTNNPLIVNITGNLNVCNNQTTTLTASGGTAYIWSNGANTASINVGAGTYSVTVTNGNGCTGTQSVVVQSTQVNANITGNLVVCSGQSTTLTANGGTSYMWSNGSTGSIITVGAGTYSVTVSNGTCSSVASATVTTGNSPVASISGNLVVCSGQSTTLTATGGTSYLWSNGSTSSSITVGAGTYSVTVSNGTCSSVASATVTTGNSLVASISGNLVVCSGQSTTLTANGGTSYLWSNGSTSSSITVGAGTYSVTVSNGTCNSVASATVTIGKTPVASISGNLVVCSGQSTTLTATGGTSYKWSNGSTSSIITVGAGTYSVTVSNGTCSSVASATVTAGNSPVANISGNLVVCSGQSTTLTATGGTSYKWSNGSTSSIITVGAGTYSVTVSNGTCSSVASATVTTGNSPVANISGNLVVCSGQSTTLTATGGTSYKWSNGSTSSSITVGAGTYSVTVSNGTCSAVANATVTTGNTPVASISGNLVVCSGQSTTLTASGGTSYKWSNGSTSSIITVGAGTYSVTVSNGTCSSVANATVITKDCNNATVGDFVWCDKNANGIQDAGEPGLVNVTVTLTGTTKTGQSVSLTTITDNAGKYLFTNLAEGVYKVTFTSPTGFVTTSQDKGGNDNTDSDVNASGMTPQFMLSQGQSNLTIDAGFYQYGSIGDFVFDDKNNNGIQDIGELGIPNVTVTLNGIVNGVPITLTTKTDANGKYLFPNLTPGTYTVTFEKPAGYTASPMTQGTDPSKDSDANPTTGTTNTIVLSSGTNNITIDAGFYKPVVNTTVGDFVWLDCNKNGMQDAGEAGIPNVTVILTNTTTGATTTTTTSSTGYYIFNNVAAGSYTITFGVVNNLTFTTKDFGTNDNIDSDVNPSTGKTDIFVVNGTPITNIDAGFQDNVKPTIVGVPMDVTVECSSVPLAPSSIYATDNIDKNVTITFNEQIINGSCADNNIIRRIWTATDDCGNVTTAAQTVTARDTKAPVFANVQADITISCSTTIPAVINPTATDNCDKSVTITYNESTSQSGGTCPKTLITREWTATDNCGNIAKTTQTVTISAQAPVINNVPADMTVSCSSIPAVPTNITATAGCNGTTTTIPVQFSTTTTIAASGGAYLIKRTWTATDACGNKTVATQTICAKDTQAPTFTGVPQNITVECNEIPAAVNPIAKDNCDNKMPIAMKEERIPGTCINAFTIKRTWTVTDDAGNSASAVQIITVQDTKAPTIIGVPADVTIQCGQPIPTPPTTITATDNCSTYVPITFSEIYYQGSCDGKSKILCQWVAKDDCGNTTVKQWYIYINGSNGSFASPSSRISKNPTEGDVNVYPNPTRGDLSIAINNIKVTKISVFDVAGRKVKDVEQLFDSNIQLNLGTEQRGIYTIQLHTTEGIITKKVLLIE